MKKKIIDLAVDLPGEVSPADESAQKKKGLRFQSGRGGQRAGCGRKKGQSSGKPIKRNLTIRLPEYIIIWLRSTGNASKTIEKALIRQIPDGRPPVDNA